MALERGKLSDVVRVAAASTVGIITVASNKKVYVKSIICHHPSGGTIGTATAQVYFCPVGVNSSPDNKIFDVDILGGETVLLEPSYPLVLDTTGDHLSVGTGNFVGSAATHINVIITGDKEA
jgi:hypothetical protein|tara:strand:+ start:2899 stop:3264 length:366 start_codon:yes stop_codon:yes gene_type:complete